LTTDKFERLSRISQQATTSSLSDLTGWNRLG